MRAWFALGMLVAVALSGCASDDADPDSSDVVIDETVALEGLVFEQLEGDSTVEDVFTFSFAADVEDVNATWIVTALLAGASGDEGDGAASDEASDEEGSETADDVAGNETIGELVADGTGLPAEFTVLFDEAGTYQLVLEVTAEGFEPATAALEVLVESVGDAADDATDMPRGPQEPIQITGSITGAAGETDPNVEPFELVSIPSKMTLTFTQGATAVDMDYYLYDPNGDQVGRVASFEAIDEGPGHAEPPIVVENAVHLQKLGEWSVEVVGYVAAAGDYTIDITFE